MKVKKTIAVTMAAAMLPALFFPINAQAKRVSTLEHVDAVSIDAGDFDRDCYFYVPSSTAVGTRSCNSPIMVVFGDKKYTAETARQEARESGLAELAAAEGSIVVFANPYGDSWDAGQDSGVYAGIIDMFSDSSGNEWVDGKYNGEDWMTGKETLSYCGSAQRAYVFSDGSGADFVADNLLKQVYTTVVYPTGEVQAEVTPTSYLLSNPHKDITTVYEGVEFPTALINGSQASIEAISKLNPVHGKHVSLTSVKTDGFDKAKVKEAYNTIGAVRRQSNTILNLPDYKALGIEETVHTATINENKIEYRQYIPNDVDMTKAGNVPLVMIFHGGGNTAEFFAWASEWPLIGKVNGFMVVSVQDHNSYTSDDMAELVKGIEKKYPAIDKSRVYASGFSMGSVKSWNCGLKHSDVFTGIAPFDAGYSEEAVTNTGYAPIKIPANANIVPVFYVGGTHSFAPEIPQADPINMNAAVEAFFKIDGVTDNYKYKEKADKIWGYKPDNTYIVPNGEYANCPLHVSEFKSTDGNTYISLGYIDKGHETMAVEAWQAWKFLSQFSRNADGSITVAK